MFQGADRCLATVTHQRSRRLTRCLQTKRLSRTKLQRRNRRTIYVISAIFER